MSPSMVEEECPACGGVRFYVIGYEPADPEVGLRGGVTADLIAHEDVTVGQTTWGGEAYCRCTWTDTEREQLELAMAKDYDAGYEPPGLP